MKKLAFFIPSLSTGGAERVVSNLSLALADKFDIYIILFDKTNINYPYKGEVIELKKYKIKILNKIMRIVQLKKLKKIYNFDYVISFMEGQNLINILTKNKEKTICTIRSQISRNKLSKLIEFMIRIFYNNKNCDIIIAVSNGVKDDLIENYKIKSNKISVIYNFVDLNKIQSLALEDINEKIKLFINNYTFITAGSINIAKGHWHLIRSFSKVYKEFKEAKLIIMGKDQGFKKYLDKLIMEYKLENNIMILGYIQNPYSIISKCYCFVLSSIFEGFPNILIETLSCGIPVISTDCRSGPREILRKEYKKDNVSEISYEEYGILVPPLSDNIIDTGNIPLEKEEELLAEAMIKIIKDKSLYEHYKHKSLERAKDFDVNVIIKKYLEILN